MTDRVKNLLLIVVSITALALGGSAIAGAASGGGGSNTSSTNNSSARPQAPAGLPPQRPGETLLTHDTAAKVREAALAKVSGGTIDRVETDADGHAAYEAHMTRSDGSRITVYVNRAFEVVGVEDGP